MQDEKQFEQLIMQYTQLKNGSEDISRMIDFDVIYIDISINLN